MTTIEAMQCGKSVMSLMTPHYPSIVGKVFVGERFVLVYVSGLANLIVVKAGPVYLHIVLFSQNFYQYTEILLLHLLCRLVIKR